MNTKTIFRKFKDGDIIAFFPDQKEKDNMCMSYMHIGQHGAADMELILLLDIPTKEEYNDLYKELEMLGYEMETEEYLDLIEHYELIPPHIQAIFDKYPNWDVGECDYEELADILEEVEEEGYTFEYYLDAAPYNLRPLAERNTGNYLKKKNKHNNNEQS